MIYNDIKFELFVVRNMTCTFIGHKDCPFSVKERLEGVILELINKDIKHFFVGNNGNFDYLVQETLSKLIKKGFSINVSIVLSYINETSISGHQKLTVFPEELASAPKKFAISKRNEYLLKNSSILVCYINNTFSNAYKWAEKARKKGLEIIEL